MSNLPSAPKPLVSRRVYFIRALRLGLIKIGVARDVQGRLAWRLGRTLLVLLAVGIAVWGASWFVDVRALRERAYAIGNTECKEGKNCEQRALRILAREAATADLAFDVAFSQAFLSFFGLAGVGFTVFYARLAWKEAERSANAAHGGTAAAMAALAAGERAAGLELRPWVTLRMEPRHVTPLGDGLYFIIDFIAENIGASVATHFDFDCEVFFMGQTESGPALMERVRRKLDEWKAEYDGLASSSLLPKDTQVEQFMNSRQPPDLLWWRGITQTDVAQPVFLAAVFYRTVMDPATVQLSWRTWYLGTSKVSGMSVFIQRGERLEGNALQVSAFQTSLMHEEYLTAPNQA